MGVTQGDHSENVYDSFLLQTLDLMVKSDTRSDFPIAIKKLNPARHYWVLN